MKKGPSAEVPQSVTNIECVVIDLDNIKEDDIQKTSRAMPSVFYNNVWRIVINTIVWFDDEYKK